MKIASIKATNMELTDAIKTYLETKAEALAKFVGDEESAELAVEVGKSTNHHKKGPFMRCEMNLSIPGSLLRSEQEREDLYEAIDMAKDDLKNQLKNHKDRAQDKQRAPRPGKE